MEPARYQIPLVVCPPRRRAWQRLYLTPTLSSTARAHHSTSSNPGHSEDPPPDSLEWTLRAEYDHEKDLFVDKPATLRRPGRDQRLCQEAQARRTALQEAREALLQAGEGQDGCWGRLEGEEQPDNCTCDTWSDPGTSKHGVSVTVGGPRVVRVRTRDSLANSLLYTPRPTHTLTVPKTSPGYARNPDGAFFTS